MPRLTDFGLPPDAEAKRDERVKKAEFIVEKKSGRVRQAGASSAEGQFVLAFKQRCERSLYCFLDGVLNYTFLDAELHKPVCDWLTQIPPYRKMLLMPRNHGKSTIVARGMPLHMMIQPEDSNIYWQGPGSDMRLVLAGETEVRVIGHLRVIKGALENNVLLRALWPHIIWDNPRKEAGKWSDTEIIIRRRTNYPEPTIMGIGVGGAITGAHPNIIIKDDLTTQKAADEPPTMQRAIEWHQDSRALMADPETSLEFITGTYWAAYDLPNFIEKNDPTVHVNAKWRRCIEDGRMIYSKYRFPGALEQLQHEAKLKFPLLYMNTVVGSALTDFNLADLRHYERQGDELVFTEDERDISLQDAINGPPLVPEKSLRGWPLSAVLDLKQVGYLRHCRGG
jgi:hypothetical protein